MQDMVYQQWLVSAIDSKTEAVILETAWVLGSPTGVLNLVARGDLVIDPAFVFAAEIPRLLELCRKYADRSMDLADASLVAAAERLQLRRIFTVDRHFHAYRIDGKYPFDVVP